MRAAGSNGTRPPTRPNWRRRRPGWRQGRRAGCCATPWRRWSAPWTRGRCRPSPPGRPVWGPTPRCPARSSRRWAVSTRGSGGAGAARTWNWGCGRSPPGHTWWSRPRRPGCTSPTRAPTAGSSTRPTWTVSPPCTACARYGSCPGCSARAGEWRPTWRPAPDRPYAASRTQEVHVQRRGAPVRRASTRAKGRASRNMPRTCDSYISAPRSQSEKSAGSARSR